MIGLNQSLYGYFVLYLAFLTFFYSSATDESFVDETRVWKTKLNFNSVCYCDDKESSAHINLLVLYTSKDAPLVDRNINVPANTENAGENSLPRIIGGSDLIAHTATNRKDLDDWFKEAIQAESQQNESEKKAQDLFNWEPNKKRSR